MNENFASLKLCVPRAKTKFYEHLMLVRGMFLTIDYGRHQDDEYCEASDDNMQV